MENNISTKAETLLREAGKLLVVAGNLVASHPDKPAALMWASAYMIHLTQLRQWLATKTEPKTVLEKAIHRIDLLSAMLQNGDPKEMEKVAEDIVLAFDGLLAEPPAVKKEDLS